MKSYFTFLEIDGKFDIREYRGSSVESLTKCLRKMGYKVYVTMTKKTYQEYQASGVPLFFDKYYKYFNDYKSEYILNKMYGKYIKKSVSKLNK